MARVTLHECRHGYASFLDAAGSARRGLTATSATPERPSATGTGTASAASWKATVLSSTPTFMGRVATVIALPLTGAPAPVSELESVTFATTRAERIR